MSLRITSLVGTSLSRVNRIRTTGTTSREDGAPSPLPGDTP